MGQINRKRSDITLDTGTVTAEWGAVNGTLRAIAVNPGTAAGGVGNNDIISFFAVPDKYDDTGSGRLLLFSRSVDTGYDALSVDEQVSFSGGSIKIEVVSNDTGEFGKQFTVFGYVSED